MPLTFHEISLMFSALSHALPGGRGGKCPPRPILAQAAGRIRSASRPMRTHFANCSSSAKWVRASSGPALPGAYRQPKWRLFGIATRLPRCADCHYYDVVINQRPIGVLIVIISRCTSMTICYIMRSSHTSAPPGAVAPVGMRGKAHRTSENAPIGRRTAALAAGR